jgi:hypothetical protein
MGKRETILNLDHVVTLVRRQGVFAYVEQTGGGCATIYAGEAYPDPASDHPADMLWPAVAGPGWFEGPAWTRARALLSDFSIGVDDQGVTMPTEPYLIGAVTEEAVARLIAAQALKVGRCPLSLEEVEALGFDGTCRS